MVLNAHPPAVHRRPWPAAAAIGWSLGAVLWLAEFVASWLWRAGGGAAGPATAMLNLALLAPLLGGTFGATVGFASSTVLAAASRIRPSIG
jgi:hypothetical protein